MADRLWRRFIIGKVFLYGFVLSFVFLMFFVVYLRIRQEPFMSVGACLFTFLLIWAVYLDIRDAKQDYERMRREAIEGPSGRVLESDILSEAYYDKFPQISDSNRFPTDAILNMVHFALAEMGAWKDESAADALLAERASLQSGETTFAELEDRHELGDVSLENYKTVYRRLIRDFVESHNCLGWFDGLDAPDLDSWASYERRRARLENFLSKRRA